MAGSSGLQSSNSSSDTSISLTLFIAVCIGVLVGGCLLGVIVGYVMGHKKASKSRNLDVSLVTPPKSSPVTASVNNGPGKKTQGSSESGSSLYMMEARKDRLYGTRSTGWSGHSPSVT